MQLFYRVLHSIKVFLNTQLSKIGNFFQLIKKFIRIICILIINIFIYTFYVFGIRISNSTLSGRIGHLIADQLYVELLRRNRLIKGKYFLVSSEEIANRYILQVMPDYFIFVKNRILRKILKILNLSNRFIIDAVNEVGSTHKAVSIFSLIDSNLSSKPFLDLPNRSDFEVKLLLDKLGIGFNDWYVCVHNRTNAYVTENQKSHAYRNSSFQNYFDTINFIYEQGGKVVRVGEPNDDSYLEIPGLIHYENSRLRNEKNDILLIANCSFFIGNTSGIQAVAGCQGIPIVGVNAAPLGACKIWGPNDIGVPKLYFDLLSQQILGFKSILNSPLGNFRDSKQFEDSSIRLIDNSSDEILYATIEMYRNVFQNKGRVIQKTNLQKEFNNVFSETNYSFHSQTPISNYFLEKYKEYIYK